MSFNQDAAQVAQQSHETATKAFEQTVASLKEGMETAGAGFEKTQAQMKEGIAKAMKTAEELVQFGQGNVEALMKSGQILASGIQDLSKHVATAAQASVEESVTTAKAMTTVKSVREAMEIQSTYTRTLIERSLAESNRMTDASMKLAEQVFAPLTARVSVAVTKFGKAT